MITVAPQRHDAATEFLALRSTLPDWPLFEKAESKKLDAVPPGPTEILIGRRQYPCKFMVDDDHSITVVRGKIELPGCYYGMLPRKD